MRRRTATTYEIDFKDAASAREACVRFDQRTLDGRVMQLSLVEAGGRAASTAAPAKKAPVKKAPAKKAPAKKIAPFVVDLSSSKKKTATAKPKKVVVELASKLGTKSPKKKAPVKTLKAKVAKSAAGRQAPKIAKGPAKRLVRAALNRK